VGVLSSAAFQNFHEVRWPPFASVVISGLRKAGLELRRREKGQKLKEFLGIVGRGSRLVWRGMEVKRL